MAMRRGLIFLLVAAIFAGCAQTYSTGPNVLLNSTGSTLLNGGTGNLMLVFNALGTPQAVTANAPNATAATVYTASPASSCSGVATIAGSTTATTSAGASGTFMVTALALNQQCTITITSSTPALPAVITVNTGYVPTAPPTSIGISGRGQHAGP